MPRTPTARGVNVLYLLTMVLLVTLGAAAQNWSLAWGLMISEVVFILLPALLYLKLLRLPLRDTLRLRWPGVKLVALSVFLGVGLAGVATWLGQAASEFLGYTVPLPPSLFPTQPVDALRFFLSLTLFAPVCEETLFRGVIQRGYERYGVWTGILVGGLLFAAYHLSFLRLMGIVPIALVLGWVVWRGDSLVPGILVHMSYNGIVGTLSVFASMRPDLLSDASVSSPHIAVVGAAMVLVGLWLFRRAAGGLPAVSPSRASAAEPVDGGDPASRARNPGCVQWLSLLAASLIFLLMAGTEFVVGRYPQLLALDQRLQLPPSPWSEPVRLRYALHHAADETVGQVEVQITPLGSHCRLEATTQLQTSEEPQGHRTSIGTDCEGRVEATWDAETLHLLDAKVVHQGQDECLAATLSPEGEGLKLAVTQDTTFLGDAELPADALLEGEWPWRLSSLAFGVGYARQTTLAWTSNHSTETEGSHPSAEEAYVVVRGAEPLATPAGNFVAWRVTVGDRSTAWYDSAAPHALLRYESAGASYVLTSVER